MPQFKSSRLQALAQGHGEEKLWKDLLLSPLTSQLSISSVNRLSRAKDNSIGLLLAVNKIKYSKCRHAVDRTPFHVLTLMFLNNKH